MSDEHLNIVYECQSKLVKLKVYSPASHKPHRTASTRGKVTTFTKRSRKRLIEKFNRLDIKHRPVFITLTYPAVYPHPRRAKSDLRCLLKRISRHYPDAIMSGIWRMEFQQRGAPHFHIIVFGMPFLMKETLQQMWSDVIHDDTGKVFTRIEQVKGVRHMMAYVSKYVAKVSPGGGFNYVPYLSSPENDDTDNDTDNDNDGEGGESIGRWWGVWNEDNLPYGMLQVVEVAGAAFALIHTLKRAARHRWERTNKAMYAGFTLIGVNAGRWFDLFMYHAVE